jgi:hypothetical protein
LQAAAARLASAPSRVDAGAGAERGDAAALLEGRARARPAAAHAGGTRRPVRPPHPPPPAPPRPAPRVRWLTRCGACVRACAACRHWWRRHASRVWLVRQQLMHVAVQRVQRAFLARQRRRCRTLQLLAHEAVAELAARIRREEGEGVSEGGREGGREVGRQPGGGRTPVRSSLRGRGD